MKNTAPRIVITTFINGTAAYAVDEHDILIAGYDAGDPKKSLQLLMNSLNQMDSETHWSPKHTYRHEQQDLGRQR